MYVCSNLVGTHNDVAQVCEIARKIGAIVIADGVSYAPHTIPDVKALGVDFYAYSTYKTFGPHQGVLWGSLDTLKKTEGQSHWFNEEKAQVRLNPTGPQHAQVAALAGITEYFDALHRHHFGHDQGNRHSRAEAVFELVCPSTKPNTVRSVSPFDNGTIKRNLLKKDTTWFRQHTFCV